MNKHVIVKAVMADLDDILALKEATKILLKQRGIDQWQHHNPSRAHFVADIDKGEFFLIRREEGLAAMAAIKAGNEPTYDIIYGGPWGGKPPYLTIHRLAVATSSLGQGLGEVMLRFAEDRARQQAVHVIRIDTHRDNQPAQRLFERMGYVKRGWIYLDPQPDDRHRLAYDKHIERSTP